MPKIKSVMNTSSRYFQVLNYNMINIINFFCFNVSWKRCGTNKWINGTTEVVRDIKHHTEQVNTSTH